jgi:hypothetical protein
MKKIGLSILMGLLVMPLALLAQPKLDFEGGRIFDWGNVKPKDSPLKAKVKLYNTGTELLKITKVVPGCGCTVAKPEKDEIAPGDSTFVAITLNINDRSAKMSKSITFHTNVPGSEKYVYMIKANVVIGYRLNPQNLNFFNVEAGKEFISKVSFENTSDKDMAIKTLKVEPDYMTSNLQEGMIIKAGETVTVECKVMPKRTENFYPRLTMTLDGNPDIEQIVIYGSGRAKASDEIMKREKNKENVQLPPKPEKSGAIQTPPEVQKPLKTEAPQAPIQKNPEKK